MKKQKHEDLFPDWGEYKGGLLLRGIIGIVILLIIIFASYMWPFSKKSSTSSSPKIVETKTFSCEGMTGFTFEYPVFEGWHVKTEREVTRETLDNGDDLFLLDPDECVIKYSQDSSTRAVKVKKIPTGSVSGLPPALTNQNSVHYSQLDDTVYFFLDANDVSVGLEFPNDNNIPADSFFQTVINSFRSTGQTKHVSLKKSFQIRKGETVTVEELRLTALDVSNKGVVAGFSADFQAEHKGRVLKFNLNSKSIYKIFEGYTISLEITARILPEDTVMLKIRKN